MIYFQSFDLLYIVCVIYMVSFSIGMGGAIMTWLTETLPASGVSLCLFIQWLFTIIIAKFMPTLMDQLGVLSICVMYTIFCFAGSV